MTSQGQRFRRRALRRGYKVDEVDSFLDRVEATLAGEPVGAPVGAQEVHDVVFRVRFGGYDEWQVDLHLDRVERQLAQFEERGGRSPDPRMAPEPTRSGGMPADRTGPSMGRAAPPTERLPAPMRDDRQMPPAIPQRQQMPAPEPYGRGGYEEPAYGGQQRGPGGFDTGGYEGFEPGRHGKADMTTEIGPERERGYGPSPMSGPPMSGGPMSGPPVGGPPMRGAPTGPPMGGAPTGPPMRGAPTGPPMGGAPTGSPMGGAPTGPPIGGAPTGPPMGGSPRGGPPMGGPPMGGPPMGGSPIGGSPMGAPSMGAGPNGELYRVDQLRRTFQPRRFGSGYDPMQVDRLFESIMQALSGRGPMPVPENDLDTLQFGLVPGGYFEAEVDAALREVKDILLRRR